MGEITERMNAEKNPTMKQLKKHENIIQAGNSNITVVLILMIFLPVKEEIIQGASMGICIQSHWKILQELYFSVTEVEAGCY